MFCKNCGSQNQDGAKFCYSCGAVLEQPQAHYQQPQHTPPYATNTYASFKAPIKERNIALCIVLSIVTLGIYGIVWFVNIVNDLNTASEAHGESSGIVVLLLGIITCGIYLYIWFYKAGEKVDLIKAKNGMPSSNTGLVYLILTFFGLGIVTYGLIQNELNKVAKFA